MVFAGPLNPAAWTIVGPSPTSFFNLALTTMVWTIILPLTLAALVIQDRLWRDPVFEASIIGQSAVLAWLVAVLCAPVGLVLSQVVDGTFSWADGPVVIVFGYYFGIYFGVIQFFSVTIGLPCTVAAVAVAYLCTTPARPLEDA